LVGQKRIGILQLVSELLLPLIGPIIGSIKKLLKNIKSGGRKTKPTSRTGGKVTGGNTSEKPCQEDDVLERGERPGTEGEGVCAHGEEWDAVSVAGDDERRQSKAITI